MKLLTNVLFFKKKHSVLSNAYYEFLLINIQKKKLKINFKLKFSQLFLNFIPKIFRQDIVPKTRD